MPILQVNTAGTIQVKLGPGAVRALLCAAAGTGFSFQLKDGPDPAGNTRTIMGQAAAIAGVAGLNYVWPPEALPFNYGLQIVTTGTPGDFEIQYD
jgi:hypothetical protein